MVDGPFHSLQVLIIANTFQINRKKHDLIKNREDNSCMKVNSTITSSVQRFNCELPARHCLSSLNLFPKCEQLLLRLIEDDVKRSNHTKASTSGALWVTYMC